MDCAARKQSLPEPADCNWPVCGCDPYAVKVIDALEEARPAERAMANCLASLSHAKRDFANELGREITTGIEIGKRPDGYCRLYLYGPDSGIDSYVTRVELAMIYAVLREIFGEG
jgi:hypothetical protein